MHKKYSFDETLKRAVVTLYSKGKRYKGVAIASADDADVTSEKTGLTIANARAYVDMHTKKARVCKNEIINLQKQIEHLSSLQGEHLLKAAQIEEELNTYLDDKAKFAENLRKMRKRNAPKEVKQ